MEICVLGGGVAGLTVAREAARLGGATTLVEREKFGRGASFAAAGMLAPLVEARLEERELVRFGYQALEYYPDFVEAIQQESGIDIGYRREGTLVVGTDSDDIAQIRHIYSEQTALGLPVEWLSGYECRRLEPSLSPSIPGGIFSGHDHQVDSRRLIEALKKSCGERYSVRMIEGAGEGRFEMLDGRRVYVAEGIAITADHFILATGAQAGLASDIDPGLLRTIRPVKGQIIRLDQSAFPLLDHVVRTPDVYLVPKTDGRLVVGASAEDRGFDANITAGEIMELLRAAWEVVPGIYELPIVETMVGFRPATLDHLPMLGRTRDRTVSIASGYYRHGILFAPLAASLLAASILGGVDSDWLETFSPSRFHEVIPERTTDRDRTA